ncbi:hypothetical protein [Kouleothrix sp.]|uniref:hypothetical protein n=1 Tax=Kouleothrix sp. TaxID=2779161 RepID=UPI0039195876
MRRSNWTTRRIILFALLVLVFYLLLRSYQAPQPSPQPDIPVLISTEAAPGGPLPADTAAPGPAATAAAGPAGGLPDMPRKPRPAGSDFQGCPPAGDGGDTALNQLKNRVDEGDYAPVSFDAVAQLAWPQAIERKRRSDWPAADARDIAAHEGTPIAVEGYLAGAKEEGPESTNCHGADAQFRDFHVWLVDQPSTDRSGAVVVEVTPRLRAKHPAWSIDTLTQLVHAGSHVRISGWLMFDPEHPEQIGKTRGTLWEIHPIMRIEVERRGQWVALDQLQ